MSSVERCRSNDLG